MNSLTSASYAALRLGDALSRRRVLQVWDSVQGEPIAQVHLGLFVRYLSKGFNVTGKHDELLSLPAGL